MNVCSYESLEKEDALGKYYYYNNDIKIIVIIGIFFNMFNMLNYKGFIGRRF